MTWRQPTSESGPGKQQSTTSSTKKCDSCGKYHCKRNICPAKGQQCHYCLKPNHLASVCRKKKQEDSKRKNDESDLEFLPGDWLVGCFGFSGPLVDWLFWA